MDSNTRDRPTQPNVPNERPSDSGTDGTRADDKARRLASHARTGAANIVERLWFLIRVWLPGMGNPSFRARTVVFDPRESRSGMVWRLTLPANCYMCGREDGLTSLLQKFDIRGYEYPLEIAGGAIGASLLFLWIAWGFSSVTMLLVAIAALVAGVVGIRIKTWTERVEIATWCCAEHAADHEPIDGSVFQNELRLVLPSDRAAEATRADLQTRRRKGRYADEGGGGSQLVDPMMPSKANFPPPPPPPGKREAAPEEPQVLPPSFGRAEPYRRVELPPIKLDGE